MIARLSERRRRFRESVEWQLTRHFFRAMFDFGILTEAGADSFRHLLLGAIGGIVAFGFLVTRILFGRYAMLASAASPEPYRRALLGDDMPHVARTTLWLVYHTSVR